MCTFVNSTLRRVLVSAIALTIIFTALRLCAASIPGVTAPVPTPKSASAITSISVEPTSLVIEGARAVQHVIVTAKLADGNVADVTATAQFHSSRTGVATVATGGIVHPVADGATTITAAVGGRTAGAQVTVRNAKRIAPISFINEVIPVLTRAGCNQGTCHGTPNGKGGFRLSLKGYAPELDHDNLVKQAEGRRVNVVDPERSLILLKPMTKIRHGGGLRFGENSLEHRLLRNWIAQGAPNDLKTAQRFVRLEVLPARRLLVKPAFAQRIVTIAHFDDGSRRDVTELTHFSSSDDGLATVTREGFVEGRKRGEVAILSRFLHHIASARLTLVEPQPHFVWHEPPRYNYIDQHVFARLKLFQMQPSELCTDEEFLHRACLDAIGMVPTASEAREFLTGAGDFANLTGRTKRERLIDQLVRRPEFSDFWAMKWADVLRVSEQRLGESGVRAYHRWIRDSVASNKPLDQMVRELLTAQGNVESNPPACYYRVASEPDHAAETTAQLFLGVRMMCARCHNHPYEKWTQDEYYSLAAFFSQVRAGGSNVSFNPNGQVQQLRTGQIMRPKFLGGEYPDLALGADRRVAFANWLTDPANPFFAKSIVNRVWYHLLARGIVDPVDDFRDSNPPANEGLLEALAQDFVQHQDDLRHLVRTIMNSRTYQLSARPTASNRDDVTFFSKANVRVLTAEQMLDSASLITGVGEPGGLRAQQIPGARTDNALLKAFNRPERGASCECERDRESNLGQALQVISGPVINDKIRSDRGRAAALASSNQTDEEIVDALFLAILSRFPRTDERRQMLPLTSDGPATGNRRAAVEDLMWVLLNSKESLTRH